MEGRREIGFFHFLRKMLKSDGKLFSNLNSLIKSNIGKVGKLVL